MVEKHTEVVEMEEPVFEVEELMEVEEPVVEV